MSQQDWVNSKQGSNVKLTDARIAQWRAKAVSFFSETWGEIHDIVQAIELELGQARELTTQPEVASDRSPATEAAPQPAVPPVPASLPMTTATSSFSAAQPEDPDSQQARLAELANRIEQRLQQSKTEEAEVNSSDATE